MHEGRRLRQALEPRRDPSAMLLRKVPGFPHAAARRHGENDLAQRGIDAQRIAARLAVPAQAHQKDRFIEDDFQRRRFGRTTIEQCAQRHGRTSTHKQGPGRNTAITAMGRGMVDRK